MLVGYMISVLVAALLLTVGVVGLNWKQPKKTRDPTFWIVVRIFGMSVLWPVAICVGLVACVWAVWTLDRERKDDA